jgi:putative ABC transport system permease protein
MLHSWLQDARYAARLLHRNPVFAFTAIVSLAIGVGANTTIFTIANALLFRTPAAVIHPGELVDVGRTQDGRGFDNGSYPNYLDIRARSTVFSGIYAYKMGSEPMSLGGPNGAERIYGQMVSTNYFSILGAVPRAGRLFSADDSEAPGAAPFVVLSSPFWLRRFNSDPAVVGQTIRLNGQPFTVIGVAAEQFHGTTILTTDVWVPVTMVGELSPRRSRSILTSREGVWLVMAARLKPGASAGQAQAELTGIAQALEREYPADNRGKGLRVLPSAPIPGNTGPVAAFVAVLMGLVALVLAIACANVAGVLLARASARRREIAVRLAIGASRGRLIRQMLVESSLLFLIGGTVGLLLARVMTSALLSLLPALPLPIDVSLPLDGRAMVFTLVLSLGAAVVSGLVPALHASRSEVLGGLKADARGGPERIRLRNAFVITEIAFSIVLVIGAGLFARALQRAAALDPGFDLRGIELASIDLSLSGYNETTGPRFAQRVVERLRALPGVGSATMSAVMPLGMNRMGLGGLSLPGAPAPVAGPAGPPPAGWLAADWNVVEPDYFKTMNIPLVSGRDFTAADRRGAPLVVIVNETAARQMWPNQNPLGNVLMHHPDRRDSEPPRPMIVIGVAKDAKYASLAEDPTGFVYVPMQQQYLPRTTIVARATDDRRLAAEIRSLLTTMDPNVPVIAAQTFEEFASIGLVPQRIAAVVAGSLGAIGMLLAAIGVYGVTAYVVSSRTREIGIRIALGARRATVVRMVLRQGMMLTCFGTIIGLTLAAAASRLLGSLLFGIGAFDPITYAGSAALFSLIGLAACYAPVRRATEIDAIEALRCE